MIILLKGEKRHGKDTIASYISNSYDFYRFGFADPIRRACKDIFLWDEEWIENHKEDIDPRWGLSYRQAAQTIGDELLKIELGNYLPKYKETTDESLWVKRFVEFYKANNIKNYVISDFRFIIEIAYIQDSIPDNNVISIEVHDPRKASGEDTHRSETELKCFKCDYKIVNDSTLQDLYKKVDEILIKHALYNFGGTT